ncbi:MAG TPA: AbrB/MazE/SpoVT family DNA-binding domain-containing protein [Candidatus Limnocylindria bacterium]|nr:AbrB/MazE/SpoVT family DNA-binding domain-containing protein [Candidatus Limnocylindria bacterium]
METSARLSSKGQITVPRSVRDALGLKEGDNVVFRVDGERATLARTPNFLDLAGSVPVPAELRGRPWSEIIEMAHTAWAVESMRRAGDERDA